MEEPQKDLLKFAVIHADETPFEVINDERKAGTNSYMWVYRVEIAVISIRLSFMTTNPLAEPIIQRNS